MKVLIITDLEGISCVDSIDMINEQTDGYKKACEYLMADTNAAIAGAIAGGADEVYVVDGHGGGNNFIKDSLDKRAILIPAREAATSDLSFIDACVMVGCHAMAGTEKAFLDHTQNSSQWFEYTVGGICYGEIGQQAISMGAKDIPVVCVTGDKASCDEAKALIKNVSCADVKYANVRNKAECKDLKESTELIFNAVCEGVKNYKSVPPYKIELPTEVKLTLYRSDYCDAMQSQNKYSTRSGRTFTKHVNEINCFGDIVYF